MRRLTIDLIRDLHHQIKCSMDLEIKKPRSIRNFTQMQIMFYLINNDGNTIYQKDICDALRLKKSSISEHIDYLESIDAIVRVQDENDRRKNSICLSSKSKDKKAEIDNALKDLNDKAIRGISNSDLEFFESIIKKMEDNLK